MKKRKKLRYMVSHAGALGLIFMLTGLSFPVIAEAAEKSIEIAGKRYEFGEKSAYEISSTEAVGTTDSNGGLGTFSVSGPISKVSEKGNISGYEVADNGLLTLTYTYDDSLLDANAREWYMVEDNKKKRRLCLVIKENLV